MSTYEQFLASEKGDYLQRFGNAVPKLLHTLATSLHIPLNELDIPALQLDFTEEYPPSGLLATGTIVSDKDSESKTIFFPLATLAVHAEELAGLLDLSITTPDEAFRFMEYCLTVSIVDLILQSTLGIGDDQIAQITDKFCNIYF